MSYAALTARDYVESVLYGELSVEAQRRIGLPWSETLAARSRASVGGTLAAARAALNDGIAGQLAGGTHHAHATFGSGFCTFNDFAVTALTMLGDGGVGRVAILDLDVHQGDGNAAILGSEARCMVVSVHGAKNFPFRKVPSDLDIALDDGAGDAVYLDATARALEAVHAFHPDLLLYLAGVDPLENDRLGRLSVSAQGLRVRDRLVLGYAHRHQVPVVVAAGGGYCDPIDETVSAYLATLDEARHVFGF